MSDTPEPDGNFLSPAEALVCWRALDRCDVEAVEQHPAFLSAHTKVERWARDVGTFACPECGKDTPHTHAARPDVEIQCLRDVAWFARIRGAYREDVDTVDAIADRLEASPTPPPPSETAVFNPANHGMFCTPTECICGHYRLFPSDQPPVSERAIDEMRLAMLGPLGKQTIQPPPSETKLKELLDALAAANGPVRLKIAEEQQRAARSSLESLYRDIAEENERLKEDRKILGGVVSQCGTCTIGYSAAKLSGSGSVWGVG